jgi:hypothetical protein
VEPLVLLADVDADVRGKLKVHLGPYVGFGGLMTHN